MKNHNEWGVYRGEERKTFSVECSASWNIPHCKIENG